MLKAVILLRRRPDLSQEEFSMHFRVHMRPLVVDLPGVSRIVVSEWVAGPGGKPAYDGMAEFWFEDIEAVQTLVQSEEAREIESRMAEFVDMEAYEPFLTVEHEVMFDPVTREPTKA
ncbi:MAG: EthD family reductase [Actinobacteria bacterium ATB1]|nr:EthD family reductase [Actinobacteria bacterium ATB1]